MRLTRCLLICLAASLIAGCASRPINERITQVDPHSGYRPNLLIPKRLNNDPSTLLILSFSGGGTRAAAFSYGVLEELRRTEIVVDGKPRRLIDEVDTITGVSGGSFTALSYALYGERLFSEYEQRFLKRNVQGDLIARALSPNYWGNYIGGSAGRSELAADYYDEILFEGATFGDLIGKQGPVALATGTDLSTGSRLAFYQNDFDLLCTNLSSFRLSRAAATSSAVPVLLSPVTLNNYGGSCNYQNPDWVADVISADARPRPSGRAVKRYQEMLSFQDSVNRPYIHLVDGGVSDNIGVRGVLEFLEEATASAKFRGELGFGGIKRVVLLVVNSHSSPKTDWDRLEAPPGFSVQLLQSSGVPIDRFSFETIETLKDRQQIAAWRRELLIAQARLAGATREQAETRIPNVSFEVIDVSFDAIRDPAVRQSFMDLPTSFALPAKDIDRLRDVAGEIMRQSTEYRALVHELGGTLAKPPASVQP